MSRLDWPPERRLRKGAEIRACFDDGTKLHTRHFLLFVRMRPDARGGIRLGFAVSRKVGPAVLRNRVKRVVRECFRLNQNEIGSPLDVVVVPKRSLDPRRLHLVLAQKELIPALSRFIREARRESP